MPDGKPVIGPVPGLSNLFLAAGHEGGGLSMVLPVFSFSDKELKIYLSSNDLHLYGHGLLIYPCLYSWK